MGDYEQAEVPELAVNCFPYELFKTKVKKTLVYIRAIN